MLPACRVNDVGGCVVNRLIFLAFSVLALCAPAHAADMGIPRPVRAAPASAPAPQQTANWSGGQIGGSNGVSSVNNNFVEPGAYVCPGNFAFGVSCFETPFGFSGHPLTYTIGPFAGYRWQVGNSVIGVEGDWSWKHGETSFAQGIPRVCFDGTACLDYRSDAKSGTVAQNWDSSLRARYGWLVNPWTLLYGTAGVAFEEISGSFNYSATGFACVTIGVGAGTICGANGTSATSAASWSDIKVGGTVGAGVEFAIADGWKARAEYRYTDFGHYTKTVSVLTTCAGNVGCSAPSSAATIALDESFHTFRVGIGFDLP
jgi:outer membrane immunogenic protein